MMLRWYRSLIIFCQQQSSHQVVRGLNPFLVYIVPYITIISCSLSAKYFNCLKLNYAYRTISIVNNVTLKYIVVDYSTIPSAVVNNLLLVERSIIKFYLSPTIFTPHSMHTYIHLFIYYLFYLLWLQQLCALLSSLLLD